MRLLMFFVLVLPAILLVLTICSGAVGLGEKENFLFYQLLGTSRSELVYWATGLLLAGSASSAAMSEKARGFELRRFFSLARQRASDCVLAQIRRARSYRPTATDIVAIIIILAYGVLCWSTIFQSYRNYEEVWTFETDGPFYVILLDLLAHGRLQQSHYYG